MVKKQTQQSEIVIKIERINMFIKKAERRIKRHEKMMQRLRKDYEKEVAGLKKLKSRLEVKA